MRSEPTKRYTIKKENERIKKIKTVMPYKIEYSRLKN